MEEENVPDILVLRGRIQEQGGMADAADISYDMTNKKAIATMNPIMGYGGNFTWSVTGYPSWAKSITIQYGVWTVSNGDVWT